VNKKDLLDAHAELKRGGASGHQRVAHDCAVTSGANRPRFAIHQEMIFMDSSVAVVLQTPAEHSSKRTITRSLTAALLIACIGVNTVFATGFDRATAAVKDAGPGSAAYVVDLSDSSQDVLDQVIDSLDEGALAELDGIYAEASANATNGTVATDSQKSWKTVLAKAILKSSAFKAALRAASERAYVWYMGHINPVLAAMDQVTSWEVVGIATALGAVGVPPSWAKIIAKVLAFFL